MCFKIKESDCRKISVGGNGAGDKTSLEIRPVCYHYIVGASILPSNIRLILDPLARFNGMMVDDACCVVDTSPASPAFTESEEVPMAAGSEVARGFLS